MEEQNYRLMKAFITNDSLSMTELTAQFHVSNRTMLKRIQDLNDDLQQIAEVRSNQQNFYLKVDDFAQLTKLQTGYLKRQLDFNDPQKRQAFILQRLIKSPTYIILDDLAEELTVSKGTLNKDIKILKKVLPNYQADIVAITNKGIKLTVAHDYNYGLLLTQLIFDYYPGEAPAMSAAQRTQLNQILGDLDEASHTTALINNNLAALAELQGADHRLEGTIPHYQTLLPRAKLAPLVALVNEVLAVQLTPTEIDFLCYPLNLKVLPATDDELLQQRLQWVHQLYQQIQTTVMGTIDIDLNFEHVFDQIRYHLLFMINRLIFKVTSDSILSDEVIEKFPVALELAMSTAKALEAQIGAAVPDTEVNYLAIYYQMEIEDARLDPKRKVAIVGEVSRSIKKLITHQVGEMFQDAIGVDTFSTEAALKQSQFHYLIIFSNWPIDQTDIPYSVPIVRINSVFRTQELISRINVSFVADLIHKKLCDFRIVQIPQKLDYFKGSEWLIQQEIELGQVNESFVDRWYKREQKKLNIYENGVAIPHVIDDSGAPRVLLTIGYYEREITYAKRKVQLVFLIGIPQKVDGQLSKALSQVYDFIFSVSQNQRIYHNLLHFDNKRPLAQIVEGI